MLSSKGNTLIRFLSRCSYKRCLNEAHVPTAFRGHPDNRPGVTHSHEGAVESGEATSRWKTQCERAWDMKRAYLLSFIVLLLAGCMTAREGFVKGTYQNTTDYMQVRERLIAAELALRFDSNLEFSEDEQAANRRLMELKKKEMERTKDHFPPAHSFLLSKELIDGSPVLEVMKRMPKGGVLHAHGSALADFRWLIEHATYLPNCYVYMGEEAGGRIKGELAFFKEAPGQGWRLVSEMRKAAPNIEDFDKALYKSITLGPEDANVPDIWQEFQNCFQRMGLLDAYRPVFEGFSRKMFNDLIEEHVQYVEFRGMPGGVYDLTGTRLSIEECLSILDSIVKDVRQASPTFDVKYVECAGGQMNTNDLARRLDMVLQRRQHYPDKIKGFDIVGEEDKRHTHLYFINELLYARANAARRQTTLPLYLHSGESNWVENENLYDAVLLDAKRIGHGLALIKHPLLMRIVKERDIAIEVCPISNQILGYVADLRNHPAVYYINSGLRVVLCPDDPGIMRYTFSYDYYVAFMAWGLDLRCLKQLAKNSLTYSAMNEPEKRAALAAWEKDWHAFIKWFNETDL